MGQPGGGRGTRARPGGARRGAAAALPGILLEHLVPRVLLSSPYIRCTETLRSVADRLALEVETRDELLPDAEVADAVRPLLAAAVGAVLCTQSELITRVLGGLDCEKGAFCVIDRRDEALEPMLYVSPGGRSARLPNESHS